MALKSNFANYSGHVNDDVDDIKPQDVVIGCALAIGGNLLISVSLNLQKYTHVNNQSSSTNMHYTRKPIWWLGFILMICGEIGNFSAYGFAAASLVAPLGTTTVIANMFIAVILLKEKLRPEDLFGSALAVIGAVLLVTFSSRTETMLDADGIVQHLQETAFIVYICIEVAALIGLFVLKLYFRIINVLILLLITSLLASCTVISAKAVSGMFQLTLFGDNQLAYAIFWFMVFVMLSTGVAQVKYLNQAMKSFNSTTVVPTNFVFFTISAIVAGIIFYRELWGMAAFEVCMFLLGCLLCFAGIYFITAGRAATTDKSPQREASIEEAAVPTTPSYADIMPSWLFSPIADDQLAEPSSPSPEWTEGDEPTSADRDPLVPTNGKPPSMISNGDLRNSYGATYSG